MHNDASPRNTPDADCDVLIIGGGPAGSTAAALLAGLGHRVALLEKSRHPRFHIGESLLPANLPLFRRLGLEEEIRAIGMKKPGAEFVSPWHDGGQVFNFCDAWDATMPYAYQVRRSEFDEVLIRNAAAKGAAVVEDCRVRDVEFTQGGATVHASHKDGRLQSWRTRFVIDASGRDTFLGNRLKSKRRNRRHNSAAMYAHFSGARRHPGDAEGNITVFWFEHGWFWFIPLLDGATSVGVVSWPYYMRSRAARSPQQFFLDTIAMCPPLQDRLKDAALVSEVEATGNFSYACDRTHGPGYLLLGDAYTFIDPVFSSGVLLAMNSAFVGAEAVNTVLREPARARAALARFDKVMRHGPREFSWFIYRVTNPTMRDLFMSPANRWRVKDAVISLLAGDIFGTTPIWGALRKFKFVYYVLASLSLKRSLLAWRRRRRINRPLGEPQGARSE
ncbi:MAG: NAD(P)/FAD-dependent oxidoreductase [Betaproteobacteria bacterium]